MKFSSNLFAIAVSSMLFGLTTALVAAPKAADLVERSGDLSSRTGDCIEMHVYIQDDPSTTNGDCATFQLWRNGHQVGVAGQCQTLTSANSVYHVTFSDGTTASTSGQGQWISVSGVSGNLNLVARQVSSYKSGIVNVLEFELAGNTANHDANGCAGYNNARLCDFRAHC
jgi:hypothetical protein